MNKVKDIIQYSRKADQWTRGLHPKYYDIERMSSEIIPSLINPYYELTQIFIKHNWSSHWDEADKVFDGHKGIVKNEFKHYDYLLEKDGRMLLVYFGLILNYTSECFSEVSNNRCWWYVIFYIYEASAQYR